jgi:oligoendopeptidase F
MSAPAAATTTGAENVIWDLSVLYSGRDDPQIALDMAEVERQTAAFEDRYRGQIATLTAAGLRELYQTLEAIYDLRTKIGTFASLNFSTFSTSPEWGAFLQKTNEFAAAMSQRTVFFELEWNALTDEQAAAVLRDPALGSYRYHLEAMRRHKPHNLTEPEEKLLMEKDVTGNDAWTRFFSQLTSAQTYEWQGEQLNQAKMLHKLYVPDRETRRQAADVFTAGLRSRSMELTYIFNVLAADKAANDKLRRYPSWISSRNLENKAPDSVVAALINSVTGSYDVVARHYRIKRALLGYEELFDYDRYAPLALKTSTDIIPWEQAQALVLESYTAFSPKMGNIARRFFDEAWIHAPVIAGKRGGAFCSYGTHSTHPFVFVNYLGSERDVMTLAHELGHGLHMYLAGQTQTLAGMYTPLTTAEMASVFGEMMVFQELMRRETDKEIRLRMLSHKIEDTFATVFRQIAMNRFEEAMHTARRTEGELSTDRLSELWLQTQKAMFQGSVTLREEYAVWWSYIPHFLHTPGYVYAYAFGELLVLALYNLYQQQGSSFVPQYEALLAAGDSDYPANLLAKIGVDLNNPGFWDEGIAAIRALVAEEEALAQELYPGRF